MGAVHKTVIENGIKAGDKFSCAENVSRIPAARVTESRL